MPPTALPWLPLARLDIAKSNLLRGRRPETARFEGTEFSQVDPVVAILVAAIPMCNQSGMLIDLFLAQVTVGIRIRLAKRDRWDSSLRKYRAEIKLHRISTWVLVRTRC